MSERFFLSQTRFARPGFVVDFYCPDLQLILELDGGGHSRRDQRAFDKERDSILKGLGYRVVRLRNEDATQDNLLRLIAGLVSPSPRSGEGSGERR